MKFQIPLFLGIIDAHLAAVAKAKLPTPAPKPQPAAPPIRYYGKVHGVKEPEPSLAW